MSFLTEEAAALQSEMPRIREALIEEMRLTNLEAEKLPEDIRFQHPTYKRGLKLCDLICEIDSVFGLP